MELKIQFPPKWAVCKSPDVIRWSSGGTPKVSVKEFYQNGTIPWLVIGDLNDGIVTEAATKITEAALESSSAKMVKQGTLLLAMYGSIGKLGIAGMDCCTNQAIAHIKEAKGLSTKFLFFYFSLLKSHLCSLGKGGTQKNISLTVLNSLEIPIPSLEEQERLVAKIEELFSILDSSIAALNRVKAQTVFYRQAAISSTFPNLSTSTQVKLAEIADISSGITKGRKLCGDNIISLPYLRVANVQNGFLNLGEVKKIEIKASEKERFLLHNDDILYTEGGDRDKLGRGTIWKDEIPHCVHQNHIFKARPNKQKVLPQYLAYWSLSTTARNYFYEKGKQSVNLASINKTVLSNLPVPLPSLDEQKNIVQEIESISTNCSDIERTVNDSLQKADSLRQSILKKAFEGELE